MSHCDGLELGFETGSTEPHRVPHDKGIRRRGLVEDWCPLCLLPHIIMSMP